MLGMYFLQKKKCESVHSPTWEQARVPPAQKPWPFSPPIIRSDYFSPVTRFAPALFAPGARALSARVFAPKFALVFRLH